jgi:hypothetical protein
VVAVLLTVPAAAWRVAGAPDRLSDAEFWALSQSLSEPNGSFRSDNLTSNEIGFQTIIPALKNIVKPGIYLGVGPEQNFTYIAALKPKMAIIADIRRGNLHLHLMYKALFEMSKDRAEFVGLLFSKPRPDGLAGDAPVNTIFERYSRMQGDEKLFTDTFGRIVAHLTKSPHTLPLDQGDLQGIQYVLQQFYFFGTSLNYGSTGGRQMVNYAELMTANDGSVQRSYLATDEAFQFMKDLESRNLLLPVVGDFAGPKALRAVGDYVRKQGDTVMAFYLSNVEDYLTPDPTWYRFCSNVMSMPLDDSSVYIFGARPSGGGFPGGGLASYYRNIKEDIKRYNCKP